MRVFILFMSIIDKYVCAHTYIIIYIYIHYCLVPSPITYCALSTASPLAVAFWQAIAYCLLPVAYCLLPIAYCLLACYCQLPIGYWHDIS